MKVSIPLNVIGAKANTGKPIGPSLAPYGIDINKAVDIINKETASFKDLEIKVEVVVETDNRSFSVNLIRPKAQDLIKKYSANGIIGTKDLENIAKIINNHTDQDIEKQVKALIGTCKSMHIDVK